MVFSKKIRKAHGNYIRWLNSEHAAQVWRHTGFVWYEFQVLRLLSIETNALNRSNQRRLHYTWTNLIPVYHLIKYRTFHRLPQIYKLQITQPSQYICTQFFRHPVYVMSRFFKFSWLFVSIHKFLDFQYVNIFHKGSRNKKI